jgi:hypothetical protein
MPQVPKNDHEEMKCKYCDKLLVGANASVIDGLRGYLTLYARNATCKDW